MQTPSGNKTLHLGSWGGAALNAPGGIHPVALDYKGYTAVTAVRWQFTDVDPQFKVAKAPRVEVAVQSMPESKAYTWIRNKARYEY